MTTGVSPWTALVPSTRRPVNHQPCDPRPHAVTADVEYALRIFDSYRLALTAHLPSTSTLDGHRILEIGPGHSLGTALLFACAGARVAVLDAFPTTWQPQYHARFVRSLLLAIDGGRRALDVRPLLSILDAHRFLPEVVEILPVGVDTNEDLSPVARRFDVVLSNAALEHVEHISKACANIASLTAPGGLGFHQIDFRDHRDFSRPLEYLTLSRADFEQLFAASWRECGNRARRGEFQRAFEAAGFEILEFRSTCCADSEYLQEIRGRLHPEIANLPVSEIECLSGNFTCQMGAGGGHRVEALATPRVGGRTTRSLVGRRRWLVLRAQLAWERLGLDAQAWWIIHRAIGFARRRAHAMLRMFRSATGRS